MSKIKKPLTKHSPDNVPNSPDPVNVRCLAANVHTSRGKLVKDQEKSLPEVEALALSDANLVKIL